jgi:hypothetical protein
MLYLPNGDLREQDDGFGWYWDLRDSRELCFVLFTFLLEDLSFLFLLLTAVLICAFFLFGSCNSFFFFSSGPGLFVSIVLDDPFLG